jgi:hypothetical protein
MSALPACGLYRTTRPLQELPAGRLVFFHNHGDPGPGVYLPERWELNQARWSPRGFTVGDPAWASTLAPLAPEGLYRVERPFACCDQQCQRFEVGQLVQLGYDAAATPLLFVPEWTRGALGFPERGTRLEAGRVEHLTPLKVARGVGAAPDALLH